MSEKANRLLKIYTRLRKGPVTIDILKEWVKNNQIVISERTLYRDLEELQKSELFDGERIIEFSEEKNKKTWKLEYSKANNEIDSYDINSFYLLKNFAPLALVHARKNSLEKFELSFYNSYSKSKFENNSTICSTQIKTTNFYEFPYADVYNKILEDCIWAIQNSRKIIVYKTEFDHTSLSASITYPLIFLPLQVLYHRGCVHIAGITEISSNVIILAVEQFADYKLTNDLFNSKKYASYLTEELNKRFGITENMDEKMYDIKIEFSQLTGSFVSNHFWHHSQKFKELSNGNFLLDLKCGINRELVGWIFQWMENCKVLQPQELVDIIIKKLQQTKQTYTKEKQVASSNTFRK